MSPRLSDNDWTHQIPENSPPNGRCLAMSSIYETDNVILFIGKSENSETWIYDLSDNNWVKKNMNTNLKPNLYYHNFMVPIYGAKKAFLSDGNGYDIWIYDFENNTWSYNSMDYKPMGYGEHKLVPVYGLDKIILTSGTSINWVYDYNENSWIKKVTSNMPNGLNNADVATFWNTDKILYFGG